MAGIENPWPKLWLRALRVRYGKGVKFFGIPLIVRTGTSSIRLGNRVRINSSILANLAGLYQRTILVARGGGTLDIGDDVGISGATLYARASIKIGRGTLIGANTKVLDNDFHPSDPAARRIDPNGFVPCRPIEIGENVFIGCNCLILKGARIGDNSVVGAGSVVCGEIPANCMAAGNPAKVRKYYRQ